MKQAACGRLFYLCGLVAGNGDLNQNSCLDILALFSSGVVASTAHFTGDGRH
jgi:hypothetical protein